MFNTKGWFTGVTKGHFSRGACPSLSAPCPSPHPSPSRFHPKANMCLHRDLSTSELHVGVGIQHPDTNGPSHSSLSNGWLLQEGKLFSWFLFKSILYIYMYICVCMYGHMYVYAHAHVYMYISISDINISYVRVVNTRHMSASSRYHILSVTLTTPFIDWWNCA